MTGPWDGPVEGVVVAFDEHAGLGTVRTGGGLELAFHCTRIADGTRSIAPGAAVRFEIVPGPLGRWEAASLVERRAEQPVPRGG